MSRRSMSSRGRSRGYDALDDEHRINDIFANDRISGSFKKDFDGTHYSSHERELNHLPDRPNSKVSYGRGRENGQTTVTNSNGWRDANSYERDRDGNGRLRRDRSSPHEQQPEPSSVHESNAIRLCEQLSTVLRERMSKADNTARAIQAVRESLDPEAVVARARAEAEAWTHGKSKLASLKAAQQLSPLGVRAVIAERDELRYQLRKAAQELGKAETFTVYGQDLPSFCQSDLDRLASIKSQVALEFDALQSRVRYLEDHTTESSANRRQLELQIATLEEQLGERSETVLQLSDQVQHLQEQLEALRHDSEERMENALAEQRRRLTAQHDETRSATLKQLESAMRAEKIREMDDLRRELETQYSDILDSKLSEQRHVILSHGNQEKVSELEALQSEMHHQHNSELERLRRDLIADKDRSLQNMRKQHASLVARLEGELSQQQQDLKAEQQRALDDLRHNLVLDFEQEQKINLSKLESKLEEDHKAELQEHRRRIEEQMQHQAAANLQKQLDAQRKRLQSQHERQQKIAVNNLKKEMEESHKLEIQRLRDSLKMQNEAELETKLKKQLDQERRRVSNTASRTHAQTSEKLANELKREKQEALNALREKLEAKHKTELEQINVQLSEARQAADKFKLQSHLTAEQLAQHEQTNKRSRSALKDRLRSLLSAFKAAILPRADAMPEVSEATATTSMRQLTTLIACLGTNEYSRMGDISAEASAAPSHTVDTLLLCCDELTEGLVSAHRELQAVQQQLMRDRKLLRKQVEDELREEHASEIKSIRVEMNRGFEHELEQRVQATRQIYDQELNRNRRDMEHQLREYQAQTAAQQRQTSHLLREKLDREKDSMVTRLQDHLFTTRIDEKAKDNLERKLGSLEKDLRNAEDVIFQLRQENDKLRTNIQELRIKQHHGNGSTSSEVHKLQLERRQLLKERLDLEKQVAALRAQALYQT
eukprot:gene6481-9355_t